MSNKNNKCNLDLSLIVGFILYFSYQVINTIILEIPDNWGYPWMIISCGLMIIGLVRTGRKICALFKE